VRPEARPGGAVQEGEERGDKEKERVVGKAAGASSYWQRAGLADEVGFDAMPDAAGGEAVTGSLIRKG
jgi:hypothetical protein